jgi:hypothetical protein
MWAINVGSSPASTDNVSCRGPVRPLPLEACVISSPPSARLSPEGSRLLSYLCICVACYRTCMHSLYVRYVHQPPGARPLPWYDIWLAAPRGAADIYVSLCFGPIWLLPVTRLLVTAIYITHLSMVILPPPCCLVRP